MNEACSVLGQEPQFEQPAFALKISAYFQEKDHTEEVEW
jgi:hypothetical protein